MSISSPRPSAPAAKPGKARARLAKAGPAVAGAAVLAAAAAGFGTRLGLWNYMAGLGILMAAGVAGALGMLLALAALAWPRGRLTLAHGGGALLGIILGFASLAYPAYYSYLGRIAPRIHDITTDPAHPPAFVALLPLRAGAVNPPGYEGARVAALQQEFYPEIKPLRIAAAPAAVFRAALAGAREAGWQVAAAVPAEGRIEAVATSFWFGFKDDVVIRIAADGAGTRVDMRSESRVGRSDFGVNARRVATYLRALAARLAGG